MGEQTAFLAEELGLGCALTFERTDAEGVEAGGGDIVKFDADGWFHAVELDADHVGFGGGDAVEAPEGGGHLGDEAAGDEVIRVVLVEMGFDDGLVIGDAFAGEDDGAGVGSVGGCVEGGGLFAGWGFGAGGFEGVEAGGEFAFIVEFHGDFRIVWRGKGGGGKWFGINVEWVVIGSGLEVIRGWISLGGRDGVRVLEGSEIAADARGVRRDKPAWSSE